MTDCNYPASWYAATRDPAPERPPPVGDDTVDVVVVGGGFAGLHAARLLAMRGRRVLVLERHCVGWGASGRNGGFVGAGFALRSAALIDKVGVDHARALYQQSRRGVAIVREAIEGAERPDLVMGHGKITAARTDQGADFVARTAELAARLGARFEGWETERVRSLIATERYFQAVHDPQSLQVHPLNLALALAADIERRGGRIHEATSARSLERGNAGWRVVTDGGNVISAAHVVLAGNADLGPVEPRVAAAVLPVATYVVVTEPLGPALAQAIRWTGAISDTRRAGDYYRVIPGGRLLWGGRITTNTDEPPRLREMMSGDIASVYPQLGKVPIAYAWAGIMGYALHKMPQVGEIERGLWVCSAYGGHGVAQTAAGADAVVAGITGEDDRWRLFAPFGVTWAGGLAGRVGVQAAYWWMQARDWWDEKRQARTAETART